MKERSLGRRKDRTKEKDEKKRRLRDGIKEREKEVTTVQILDRVTFLYTTSRVRWYIWSWLITSAASLRLTITESDHFEFTADTHAIKVLSREATSPPLLQFVNLASRVFGNFVTDLREHLTGLAEIRV